MATGDFEELMWARACDAMERAQRLHRQFFHRPRGAPCWQAPCDIFETEEALTILVALPGVDPEQIRVSLNAGVLVVTGERPLPRELDHARIHRLEIPHGRFERRIELPPARFELFGRHCANGCLMVQLHKL
jgi:HSP20 family protein